MDKGYMLIYCVEGTLDAIQFGDYTDAHCEMLMQLQDISECSDEVFEKDYVSDTTFGYDAWSAYFFEDYDNVWKIIPIM